MLLSPVIWVACLALYLLFVGQASAAELAAGAITSALAAAYHLHVYRFERRRFALRVPWLRLVGRVMRAIAVDTPRVGACLARAVICATHGEGMIEQPFDTGDATPHSAARRALVILAASVAPNAYVIDVRSHPPGLLEHLLVPRASEEDRQWPV